MLAVARAPLARRELAAMTALLLSYIWLWQDAFPGDFVVCVVLYATIGLSSHLRRGESAADVGFRLDNFLETAKWALWIVGPLLVLPILIGAWLGTLHFPAPRYWLSGFVEKFLWSTAQQYGLAAFYYRRLRELLPGNWTAIIAAAGCFSLFHLPNPLLTPVTFLAGIVSCWLYRKEPNLFVLGLAHALLALSISRSLPFEITFGMRVGPGFFSFLERLSADIVRSL